MNKIEKLKDEIRQLEEKKTKGLKSKYTYLIGTCIHSAHTSYRKITSIDYVEEYGAFYDIGYSCINVYFDNRGDDYNIDASISINTYSNINSENIERYIISNDKFNIAFESCIDFLRRKTK